MTIDLLGRSYLWFRGEKMNRRIQNIGQFFGRYMHDVVSEAAIIGGFFMLMKGLYMIYPPVMWIVGGILIFLLGFPAKKG